MKKILLCFFVFIAVMPNKISGQFVDYIAKLDKANPNTNEAVCVYALPRSIFQITVYGNKNSIIAGPYASYANQLLSIKNAYTENSEYWTIDSIHIQLISEADPEQYYVFKPGKKFDFNWYSQILKTGVITLAHHTICHNETLSVNEINGNQLESSIPTIIPNLSQYNDTIYKTVIKDSLLIRIPVVKQKTDLKSAYDKAVDLSNIIFKIRQRRFELIMSEDETLPEEASLKFVLSELHKLEQEYLSLFTGRNIQQPFRYITYYIPNPKISENQIEIFRFSEKNGISDRNDPTALPVCITIQRENVTNTLANYSQIFSRTQKNMLFYRVPDIANVSITLKTLELLNTRVKVFQYGTVVSLPVVEYIKVNNLFYFIDGFSKKKKW